MIFILIMNKMPTEFVVSQSDEPTDNYHQLSHSPQYFTDFQLTVFVFWPKTFLLTVLCLFSTKQSIDTVCGSPVNLVEHLVATARCLP